MRRISRLLLVSCAWVSVYLCVSVCVHMREGVYNMHMEYRDADYSTPTHTNTQTDIHTDTDIQTQTVQCLPAPRLRMERTLKERCARASMSMPYLCIRVYMCLNGFDMCYMCLYGFDMCLMC